MNKRLSPVSMAALLGLWVWMSVVTPLWAAESDMQTVEDLSAWRPGPAMSLADALRLADKRNRSLLAARADLRLAAGKLKASWSVLLPTFGASLGYTYNDHNDSSTVNGVTVETRPQHQASVGLEARMPLISARTWLGVDAARLEQRLAELGVEQARQEILYATAEAYFQAATLMRLIDVYRAQFQALERHHAAAAQRYRAGVGGLVDVKRARMDMLRARESMIEASFALEDARDALAILTASDSIPLPKEEPGSVSLTALTLEKQDENAHANRWDVKIARETLHLQKKRLNVEWMDFLPTLSASWQYAYDLNPPDSSRPYDRDRWAVGLVLSLPIFDYTRYPALQMQRAAIERAAIEAQDTKARAKNDLNASRRALVRAEALVATSEAIAQLADDTLVLAQTAFINGTGSALAVIDASRSGETAHVDLASRRFELELTRLGMIRALGLDILSLVE